MMNIYFELAIRNRYDVPNGTKLRGIVIMRATYLSFKSSVFPIKRRLAEPLRRSNMLNLVPLYDVPRKNDKR
jgi:hypothetical protein